MICHNENERDGECCYCCSGESAFLAISQMYAWAKHPMIRRIGEIDRKIPMSYLAGVRSWIDVSVAYAIQNLRGNDCYVAIHVSFIHMEDMMKF